MEFQPDIPRWRQVYDVIVTRIDSGEYAPRERIPSVLQIQAEFGIAVATAQKVHAQLRADGLIYTEPGLGSFVSGDKPKRDPAES